MPLVIAPADLTDPRLHALLRDHLADMAPTAPPESRHALDLTGLAAPGVQLWAAESDGELVGTVALAPVAGAEGGRHLELKSMRTDPARRGEGIGAALLVHALGQARTQGAERVSLETGTAEFFAPAHRLYRRHGFTPCPPFGAYVEDPHSRFLTLAVPG
ncbi:GNAT family N-acetyltransferase [Brachybacterium squillarum]|uniref:GNAT family N-acetyltransferase n=1 Tax=Brachybacterium squillarum TaxID=661979 RepID=UPI000262A3F9|nr:GNAT family N-acetyltransferase [Brachybacterium squillarum]